MQVNLHANATTTPKVRAYIQQSTASVEALANELGVSHVTVRRWKVRHQVHDRSHCRHRLGQSTSLEEETLICQLRRDIGLSLDDLVEVMQRCVNPALSRSAIYRCLKRYGLSRRITLKNAEVAGQFEHTPFGFVHIDLKHLTRLRAQTAYVFVAIERTTRFVYVEIVLRRDAATIAVCLKNFLNEFQYPVHTILTDNGAEFTDRYAVKMKNKPKDKPT
ncbi:MAG: transposase family protein, partial [Gammaproteobacteria bacterium]|nr:transposase family protein [Gammaproteobacteria bacterium]